MKPTVTHSLEKSVTLDMPAAPAKPVAALQPALDRMSSLCATLIIVNVLLCALIWPAHYLSSRSELRNVSTEFFHTKGTFSIICAIFDVLCVSCFVACTLLVLTQLEKRTMNLAPRTMVTFLYGSLFATIVGLLSFLQIVLPKIVLEYNTNLQHTTSLPTLVVFYVFAGTHIFVAMMNVYFLLFVSKKYMNAIVNRMTFLELCNCEMEMAAAIPQKI